MSDFTPRYEFPEALKYDTKWLNYAYGGSNFCVAIDSLGSTVPNCTGYAWGRATEILGHIPNLSTGNAKVWFDNPDGYRRSQRTPKLGSIACFDSTVGGNGHVSVVEYIRDADNIITGNSAYNGSLFWLELVTYDSDSGKWVRPYSGYSFQGFINITSSPSEKLPIWMLFKFKEGGRA